jgi:hypothetical protein
MTESDVAGSITFDAEHLCYGLQEKDFCSSLIRDTAVYGPAESRNFRLKNYSIPGIVNYLL